MSIFTALRAGVSGLASNSSALAAISDNIANVSTVGYRRVQSDFSALLSTSDINSTIFNAGGVTSSTRRFVDVAGPIEQTTSATDLTIVGDGFFIVTDDALASSGAGGGLFTRAGSFSLDGDGRLVNAQGFFLLGAPILPGQTDPDPSSLAALAPINLSGVGANAEQTENVAINANLDSRTVIPDATAVPPPAILSYTAGDFVSNTITPDVERSIEIIDSLGTPRSLTVGFSRIDASRWQVEVFIRPNPSANPPLLEDVPDGGGGFFPNGFITSGVLEFGLDGQIDPATIPASLSQFTVPFDEAAVGIAQQPINFDFSSVTQFAIPSTLNSATADGSIPGSLIGVTVTPDGVLTAQFSNGQSEALFLIPVATFLNPNGLQADSGSVFRITPDSGLFTLNTPGQGGAGIIQSNALESSNVDLGTEFALLIVTQRAYTASSQIIQTADQLLQELINIPN